MTIYVKELGLLSRFNEMNVQQTRNYMKLYNCIYIEKITLRHTSLNDHIEKSSYQYTLSMIEDITYQRSSETAEASDNLPALESKIEFGYRQVIGESIYTLLTYMPDII